MSQRQHAYVSVFAAVAVIGLFLYMPALWRQSSHIVLKPPLATTSPAAVILSEDAPEGGSPTHRTGTTVTTAPEKPVVSTSTVAIATTSDATSSIATTSDTVGEIATTTATSTDFESPHTDYIEIIGGCGPYYDGDPCVKMYSGPGKADPVVARLRNGIVLRIEDPSDAEKRGWYKIIFDKTIRYPERITSDWYVEVDSEFVRPFKNIGDEELTRGAPTTTTQRITIDLSEQKLYAYEGDTVFMETPISTGNEFNSTPVGTFTVYRKTPSRYMQGPIPDVAEQYYDVPGVPWNLYFTRDGAVIHGAYWHDNFGRVWSHGCVNLPPERARELYLWANIGAPVTVQE